MTEIKQNFKFEMKIDGPRDLVDAALATQPIDPVVTAPDRRKRFRVIEGGSES